MTPTIEQFMTPAPHTIGADQTLETAERMMSELGVRHLPVRDGGVLVGLLSQRDLNACDSSHDTRRLYTPVREVMEKTVYHVRPETPLTDVVREMAERRFGSALVVDNHHVVGIFTSVDAARVLAELVDRVRAA